MPRISKSELSSAKEMTQKSRLEILNKFGKFETEVKEFEGTNKLKGKSWDSAKQHFGEYLPISEGIFNALADFGERFEQYLAAFESEVGSPKNKLDTADLEDLNDRLKTVKASKAQVLEIMKSKITQSYVAGGYSGSVGQSFDNAMEDINKDIQVLEDYRRFESSHASDFSAVSEAWDHIDTYLDRLKKEGGYDASSNTYPSVDFSQEKFYKELSSYNASQTDHYEVQRIAVKTDHGYTYEYRLYKNGLYDPESTDKFNQLQKKAEMDQAKDFFKEVVGINDYIRMVDGIDPLTGKKITHNEQAVSSLMFLLTVVSEATALKIFRNVQKGNRVFKDVDFDIDLIRSKLKTEPDTAFFWSGRTEGVGGADVAAGVAKSKGGVTLETTIDSKKIKMPEWDFNNPAAMEAWDLASGAYAEQVSGEIRAVVGAQLREGNIWENVELPRLKNNPNVTKITIIDPKTGIEKVIFERK